MKRSFGDPLFGRFFANVLTILLVANYLSPCQLYFMKISSIVAIYLEAVTSMAIPLSALNALSFLKSTADSAERRLISALELKIQQGIIQVIPGMSGDHPSGSFVTY